MSGPYEFKWTSLNGSVKGFDRAYYKGYSMGALVVRTGFWGILYCCYDKEPRANIT